MEIETEADRLSLLEEGGGRSFSTGNAEKLIGILRRPSVDAFGQSIPVKNRKSELYVRESDVALHGLVKQSVITDDLDGKAYVVRDFDPDGEGMTVITLGS